MTKTGRIRVNDSVSYQIGHIQKETPNSALYLLLWNGKHDLQKLVSLLNFGRRNTKWDTPKYSHCHAMAGLIRTFLTDREILN